MYEDEKASEEPKMQYAKGSVSKSGMLNTDSKGSPFMHHFEDMSTITQDIMATLNMLESRLSLAIAPASEQDSNPPYSPHGESKIAQLLAAHQDDLSKILDQIRYISQRVEV